MDFIKKLPSSSSFDTILVLVDCLSKQDIFIPTHDTITSVELVCLSGTCGAGAELPQYYAVQTFRQNK